MVEKITIEYEKANDKWYLTIDDTPMGKFYSMDKAFVEAHLKAKVLEKKKQKIKEGLKITR